ncbi:MAG: hypothetical protein R3B13_38975 [Polyangiaceae bacterium]
MVPLLAFPLTCQPVKAGETPPKHAEKVPRQGATTCTSKPAPLTDLAVTSASRLPVLGNGFDYGSMMPKTASCLTVRPPSVESERSSNDLPTTQVFRVAYHRDGSSLAKEVGFSAQARYSSLSGFGAASGSFYRRDRLDSETVYVSIEARVLTQVKRLENAAIRPEFERGVCGHGFISSVGYGSRLAIILRFEEVNTSARTALETAVSGNYAAITGSATVARLLASLASRYHFEIEVFQVGGGNLKPEFDVVGLDRVQSRLSEFLRDAATTSNAQPVFFSVDSYESARGSSSKSTVTIASPRRVEDLVDQYEQAVVALADAKAIRSYLNDEKCKTSREGVDRHAQRLRSYRSKLEGAILACRDCTASCRDMGDLPAPDYDIPVTCRPACDDAGNFADARGFCTKCERNLKDAQVSRANREMKDTVYDSLACKAPVRRNAIHRIAAVFDLDISRGGVAPGCTRDTYEVALEASGGTWLSEQIPKNTQVLDTSQLVSRRVPAVSLAGDLVRFGGALTVKLTGGQCFREGCVGDNGSAVCRVTTGRLVLTD